MNYNEYKTPTSKNLQSIREKINQDVFCTKPHGKVQGVVKQNSGERPRRESAFKLFKLVYGTSPLAVKEESAKARALQTPTGV